MQPPPARKLQIARSFGRTGLNRLLLAAQRRLRSPYIRVVNYHDIPVRHAESFEEQMRFFATRFDPVGLADLIAYLEGRWAPKRPGLVISFDDGLRSHAEIAAPVLDRYGFPGWFAVPASFPDRVVTDHQSFHRENQIEYEPSDFDGRGLLSWDEVRKLSTSHVICCHSHNHRRLSSGLSDAEREQEIPGAKAHLEKMLGQAVRAFVWVGGEESSYSVESARAIRDAGFELSFMTNYGVVRPGDDPLQIQRTNIEAEYPLDLVGMALSGFFDLMYLSKRRRVNRITAV